MKESDMPIADEILQRLKNQYGGITDAEIEELTTDNAQAYRICRSLCDSGVATKDSIGLSGTGKTAFVISECGAKYIYEREQEDINTRALENESLKLSVAEMKRNKVAFWLTILNSIILLPTVFKMVKALILYLSNLF